MEQRSTNLLYTVSFFSEMGDQEINQIGDLCDWQRFSKGKEIIGQTEKSTDIFFVIEGHVAAKNYSPDGKEVNYTKIGPGEMFGEFSAIDGQSRSTSIETLEESFIARMNSALFRELIVSHPSLGLKLADHLVQKNRYLTQRVFEFSTLAVRYRVCAELIRMIDTSQTDGITCSIEPAPSHYQIATRISTHREAVSRELERLSSSGILEIGRQKIKILNIPKLKSLIETF